jgi:uncharacterized protein YjbJ (UPF0337 family)
MGHDYDEDESKGAGKQVKGKIKEAAGVLTGDEHLEAEGKLEKTEGKAQEKIGGMKRDLHEDTHSHRHHDEDEDF